MKKTLLTLLALSGLAMGEDIALTLPAETQNNSGVGSLGANDAILHFAASTDGGYMFNAGGRVSTNTSTGEGILSTADDVTSLTLCPRTGAGGSGEVIILSANELDNQTVSGFTFNINSSSSQNLTGSVTLTLAVIQNTGDAWQIVQQSTGSLTIGSGSSLTLDLTSAIENWSGDYKVAAMVDNTAKNVSGTTNTYTMSGISIVASTASEVVPEPTSAMLSLLALAGLASRRRRK